MALTKVSGGILDPGISVAGIVTATGFDGPFIGGSSKNIVAGIITATELDLNGNADISGNLVIGGNLTANGDFTTLNTTLREVELLRVDAQNDNVAAGIITQRGLGDILNLFDNNTEVLTVKDGGNVGIGSDDPTQKLVVKGKVSVFGSDGSGYALTIDPSSSGGTYETLIAKQNADLRILAGAGSYQANRANILLRNTSKHIIMNYGATDGNVGIGFLADPQDLLTLRSTNNDTSIRIVDPSNNDYGAHFSFYNNENELRIGGIENTVKRAAIRINRDANDNAICIDDAGKVGIGITTPSQKLNVIGEAWIDNNSGDGTARSNGLTVSHAPGSNFTVGSDPGDALRAASFMVKGSSRAAIVTLRNADDNSAFWDFIADGNTNKFYIQRGIGSHAALGAAVSIDTSLNVGIGTDNTVGARLRVHKDGLNETLQQWGGNLGSTTGQRFMQLYSPETDSGSDYFRFQTGNAFKFQVDSLDALCINSGGRVGVGTDLPTKQFHVFDPSLTSTTARDNTVARFLSNASNADCNIQLSNGVDHSAQIGIVGNGAEFYIAQDGVERWKIDSSGHLLPGAAGTQNLGSATLEWGNIYIADSKRVFLGSDQDTSIYHDGTHSYFTNTTGNIFITNSGYTYIDQNHFRIRNAAGNHMFDVNNSGTHQGVGLYYTAGSAGTEKLRTSATGITVNGEVAASQDYPTVRPTLNFNFTSSKKLDPRFTYQRKGPASYVNEFGKVVLVSDNVPRFDYGYEYVNANSYKLSRGESKGLLIEGPGTNFVSYSIYDGDKSGTAQTNTGDTGNWSLTLGHATLTGGIDAPDGSDDAVRFTSLNTGFSILRIGIPAFTPNGSDNYTLSFYARAISGTGTLMCDLNDGAPLLNGWTNNLITNEWVRIVVIGVPSNASKSFVDLVSNSNTNRVIDFWGVQLEQGRLPTSFIPTRGATVERGAEDLKIDGEEFTNFYNPLESTVVCEFDSFNWLTYNNNQYERLWAINNGTDDESFEVFKRNSLSDSVRYRVRGGGANVMGAADYSYGTNTTPKVAFALKLNDAAVTVDGGTPGGTTDNSIPMPTVDRLTLGNYGIEVNTTNRLHGHLRSFTYYPVKLPDSQIITLTS